MSQSRRLTQTLSHPQTSLTTWTAMNFPGFGCFIPAQAELKNQKARKSKAHTKPARGMQDSTATALSSVALICQMLVYQASSNSTSEVFQLLFCSHFHKLFLTQGTKLKFFI